jgi:hypothetical protein
MSNLFDKALFDVRTLCAQLGNPMWMDRPRSWIWKRPDGMSQGFGPDWQNNPGRANLLWLSMDLSQPPLQYDAGANGLYTNIMMLGHGSMLAGAPLLDMASTLPLRTFAALLPGQAPPGANRLEQSYPLMRYLAHRRLG